MNLTPTRPSMSLVRTTLSAIAVLVLATGCTVDKKTLPLVSALSDAGTPKMTVAAADGDYLLYRANEPTPFARTRCRAGDPIGFKAGGDAVRGTMGMSGMESLGGGQGMSNTTSGMHGSQVSISAVAGTFVVPLKPNDVVEWRYVPSSNPNDPNVRTNFVTARP